jgi:hypothetical protein
MTERSVDSVRGAVELDGDGFDGFAGRVHRDDPIPTVERRPSLRETLAEETTTYVHPFMQIFTQVPVRFLSGRSCSTPSERLVPGRFASLDPIAPPCQHNYKY